MRESVNTHAPNGTIHPSNEWGNILFYTLNHQRLTFHLGPGAAYSRCPGLKRDRSPKSVSKPGRVCGGYAPFLIGLLTH